MPSGQMLVKTVNGLAGHLFASYAHWHYEEREQESDGASSEAVDGTLSSVQGEALCPNFRSAAGHFNDH